MIKKALAALALIVCTTSSFAAASYIGAWDLYSGTEWWTGTAQTLTGQEAAAQLFGGVATEYAISTNGNDASTINFSAWYDQYGYGPAMFAQDYRVDNAQIGIYDTYGDTSARIIDNAGGRHLMNYAFRIEPIANVPEPVSLGLLAIGLLGIGVTRKRFAR